jgi:hypothetical protein
MLRAPPHTNDLLVRTIRKSRNSRDASRDGPDFGASSRSRLAQTQILTNHQCLQTTQPAAEQLKGLQRRAQAGWNCENHKQVLVHRMSPGQVSQLIMLGMSDGLLLSASYKSGVSVTRERGKLRKDHRLCKRIGREKSVHAILLGGIFATSQIVPKLCLDCLRRCEATESLR